MRRFSQRSHLVTLSEINITPLLDLAFVLLIIFIITTPLLERGLDLKLPTGRGSQEKPFNRNDIRTVDISPRGEYAMNKRTVKLNELVGQLVQDFRTNPNLIIYIRADQDSKMRDFVALADACTQKGISKYSIRTSPPANR
ncbi:MAG: biopolymer transporter ExbD [Verrucomicrobia bacterium]|nr:biopolymer transporter ExbD [Verrucomicrobiota bacterium]